MSGIWSAIGSIVGGFFGGPAGATIGSSIGGAADSRRAETQARRDADNEVRRQEQFARSGIQWRVADALAAGVSPLYALGGGGAAYSPAGVSIGSGGGDGQDISRAAFSAQAREDRLRLQAMQEGSAAAQREKDHAQAQYYDALAAKTRQEMNQAKPVSDIVSATGSNLEMHPLYQDAMQLTPDPMVSRSKEFPGTTAGRDHPAMRQFELPGGFRALLPATQGGGVPEDVDISLLPLVIGANLERFGPRWLNDLLGYITGRSPDDRRGKTLESWLYRKGQKSAEEVERYYNPR